ncbi:hypothetical protein [Corynebacterium sp. Marseille-P4321]|uniref:hypothetical protein n=1 Tax=Corynebacterium sp. Marseille-P4321 TaxID=2736603 RepID=UPI00158C8856|nr:hypothetical protein [Corynebacterium sp. Marseille-P4321]
MEFFDLRTARWTRAKPRQRYRKKSPESKSLLDDSPYHHPHEHPALAPQARRNTLSANDASQRGFPDYGAPAARPTSSLMRSGTSPLSDATA